MGRGELRFSSNFARFLAAYFRRPRDFSTTVFRVRGIVGVVSMKRFVVCIAGALTGLLASTSAMADHSFPAALESKSSPFMRVYGPSQPPYGFVRFCESNAQACAPQRMEDVRFQPTPERLSELDEVNRWANHVIAPATDQEIYGVSEFWTFPTDRGDCEDYALLKQSVLLARGWPKSSLLLTVVRDEKGEGHAVLTGPHGAGRLRSRQQGRRRPSLEYVGLLLHHAPVVSRPARVGVPRRQRSHRAGRHRRCSRPSLEFRSLPVARQLFDLEPGSPCPIPLGRASLEPDTIPLVSGSNFLPNDDRDF